MERKLEMPEGARCLTVNEEGVLGGAGGVGRGLVGAGTGWGVAGGAGGAVFSLLYKPSESKVIHVKIQLQSKKNGRERP